MRKGERGSLLSKACREPGLGNLQSLKEARSSWASYKEEAGFIGRADCIATTVVGIVEGSFTGAITEMVATDITDVGLSNLWAILTGIIMAGIAAAKD